ncbi:MAG: hypothetical protein ACLPN6_00305 [Streptosporangiaceae bacterium]|jgi:hypothetical protein
MPHLRGGCAQPAAGFVLPLPGQDSRLPAAPRRVSVSPASPGRLLAGAASGLAAAADFAGQLPPGLYLVAAAAAAAVVTAAAALLPAQAARRLPAAHLLAEE